MKRFYWIVRNSQRVGPFGLEALQDKVNSGEFTANDFVFYPGCKGLERLSSVEGIKTGGDLPASMPVPPPAQRPVTFTAPPEGYNALPPIRQTVSISHPTTGASATAENPQTPQTPPTPPRTAPPPRARLPEPGSVTDRIAAPAPQAPRTVAPRITSTVQAEGGAPASSGSENAAPRKIPNLGVLQNPEYAAEIPPGPPLEPQPQPAPRKPTQVVSRRDLPAAKDSTERLDPILPQPAQLPPMPVPPAPTAEAGSSPSMEIDFSSIEAALAKPAPTGASVKIPAPTAGARPLTNLGAVGAELEQSVPASMPQVPKIVTKRLTAPKPAPHTVSRAPLQPAMAFAEEMFSKQTLAINLPPARPRRAADAAYPQVISKPEEKGPIAEVKKEPPREVLDSVKYTELAQPTEPTPVVEPEFTNNLGMGFVQVSNLPIGFGLWQVRVRDFRAFCDATDYDAGPKWRSPDFLQLEDNPVIFVSWLDAIEFCKWLTLAEQEAGWIDSDQYYRLPSDLEWSAAVGLFNEPGHTPAQRHGCVPGVYPWGKQWPPPPRVGNFADESAARRFGWDPVAPGYDDGQVYTAKVGSYHVSPTGVYDLSGNAWEWVEDWFDETETRRTLRGGSWTSSHESELLSSARDSDLPDARRGKNGFRVVLATV